jgi:uroporphyrinogen decarboxylase
MNHKERVLAAINLEEPDRIPISPSGFHKIFLEKLFKHFNVNDMIKLYKKLDLDAIIVSIADGMITYPKNFIPKRLPDGSLINEWNVRYIIPPDRDHIFIEHPIKNLEDFDKYSFPDPCDHYRFIEIEEIVNKYSEEYAIVASIDFGLFEKACLLHGISPFLMDLYKNPIFVEKILNKLTEFDSKLINEVCKYDIDIFFGSDDLGTQHSLFFPPEIFRKFFKERWRKLLEIPRNRKIPIMFHSDGNIEKIIPDLIDIGVDILNPIQPRALNPKIVKEKYGEKIAQWGTIDIQYTLPFGTINDIINEVLNRIRTVGYDGGLVLAPSHTILPDVPIENYLAFIIVAKKYGIYPIKI